MNKDKDITKDEQGSSTVMDKNFKGSITKVFEGDNTLDYGFNLPETATATVSMNGALVKVTDTDMPVLAMYVSFEGGRGYSPADYITNTIIPKVSAATIVGTTTIGENEWTIVESKNSVWHVTKVGNGNWLLVVENTKAHSEKANPIIASISAAVPAPTVSAKVMDPAVMTDMEATATEVR